jgi:ATP-binding cassette subfamily B protein
MRDSIIGKIRWSLRLGRALQIVWKSSDRWTVANVVLLFIQGLLPLASLYLIKLTIDAVGTGVSAANKGEALTQIMGLIVLSGLVALLGSFCESIAELVSEVQAQVVSDYIATLIHAKSIEVDLEYYENGQYYDALHRAQQEASYRPTSVLNNLIGLAQNSVSSLALAGLLVSLNWAIAILLILSVLPGTLMRLKYDSQLYRWRRQKTEVERQAYYLDWMLTAGEFAKEIRLFNLGKLFADRFHNLRRQLYREQLKLTSSHALMQLLTQISTTLAVFGSYAFITYRTLQGTITLGELVMYYQGFQRLQSSLQGILGSLTRLYSDNLFLSNLYEFLDLRPKLSDPAHPQPVPQPMQAGIAFQQVSFQYANSRCPALQDITLTVHPGEVVALVGENGSGKTTLIKLLCRLYDPNQGSISWDGIDLRDFNTADLRRQISVIFQDYVCYNLSARDNIWLGNIDCPPDAEAIAQAARRANADRVIAQLPQGYDTLLGNLFQEGEELSIGQWQKIAMARAFLRDSQIIILDEPTSALDPKAEAEVFAQFRQLLKGQAAILISHRLSSVKMADCIYVLDRGKIVEQGSHPELMDKRGLYRHLFETQAQHYR